MPFLQQQPLLIISFTILYTNRIKIEELFVERGIYVYSIIQNCQSFRARGFSIRSRVFIVVGMARWLIISVAIAMVVEHSQKPPVIK